MTRHTEPRTGNSETEPLKHRPMIWRLLAAAITLALSLGLATLTLHSLRAANTDQPESTLPADERPAHMPATTPAGGPERVILIVLDGLRLDTACTLPTLKALASRGGLYSAMAPEQSFSRASYATMMSGTTPERHGLRNNSFDSPLGVDTLLDRARSASRRVVGVGDLAYWGETFKPGFDAWTTISPDDGPDALERAQAAAIADDNALLILHMVAIDRAGHRHGVGDAYQKTAERLDASVGRLLSKVDLEREAVFIVSDHGHRLSGGHGGPEAEVLEVPLIALGRGIRRAHSAAPDDLRPIHGDFGALARLAPTISVLMGLPFPSELTALPWFDGLNPVIFDEQARQASAEQWRAHRSEYERRWLKRTYDAWTSEGWNGEDVGNRVSAATVTPYDAKLDALIQARDLTLEEISRDRRVGRTPLIGLLLVPLAFLLLSAPMLGYGVRPWAALPVMGVSIAAFWLMMGWPLTMSFIDTHMGASLRMIGATMLGFSTYGAVLWALVRALPAEDRGPAWRLHATTMVVCYASLAPLLWLLRGFGLRAPLPSAEAIFIPTACGAIGASAVGLMAVIWGLTALIGSKSTHRPVTKP